MADLVRWQNATLPHAAVVVSDGGDEDGDAAMDSTTMVEPVAALTDDGVHELIDDEGIVAGCSLPFLITASSNRTVEAIARRVHAASSRAVLPFVRRRGGALPTDLKALDKAWSTLMQAATGGSLLLLDIEETPPIVQGRLIGLLADMHAAGESAAVRFIAGTTVSLCERIACGAFSESLFYRLNLVHVVANRRARAQSRREPPSGHRLGRPAADRTP